MTEMILNTMTLPKPLLRFIHTEKVKAREADGQILLTPIRETDIDCPLLGMFADGKISSYKFSADKQVEKEFEL
ncbi:MAG: hypothetical protein LBS84_07015 [Clostridiales bacterium]|nr:hypothetical protein [Clostridiales bacterium]